MGKKAKDHRKKIAKRNEEIKLNQKRFKKAQEDIMQIIEREKAAGKFDNNPSMKPSVPHIDLGEGPQI